MKKKIGLSKVRPKNEARPLGTPRPKAMRPKVLTKVVSEDAGLLKIVDTAPLPEVESPLPPIPATDSVEHKMTITFKSLNKKSTQAYYSGAAVTLRFPLAAFPGKVPPTSIHFPDDTFAAPKVKAAAKPKLTAEERKALRAAKPKPTEAERIAQAEARLAKRKAKLAEAAASL